MKTRFLRLFGRGGSPVERELAAHRPEPSETLVRAISAKIQQRPTRSRARVGFALGLSAAMIAALGAFGGLGYASSSIHDATSSLTKLVHATSILSTTHSAARPSKAAAPTIHAACTQYSHTPTFLSVFPTSGAIGDSITIKGTNFAGDSAITSIKFHGNIAATPHIISNTTVTTHVPFGATSGVITLTNCVGSVNTTSFPITVKKPALLTRSPTSGPYKTPVTLKGHHFSAATSVKFGTKSATFTVLSDQTIVAKVPFGAGHSSITITDSAGTSNGLLFTETYVTAHLTTRSPSSAAYNTNVTLTGTHFSGTTAVKFGTVSATTFTLTSDTSITAKVPFGAHTGNITVINPAGTSNGLAFTVTYVKPSAITFAPTHGPVGTSVTITGSHFNGTTAVKFGTKAATTKTVVSDTKITATVPSGATTGKISVTNPAGTGISTATFTVG